jgi:hypothetical protein
MNREQWQQKRVQAGAKRAAAVPGAVDVARRVQTTPAPDAAKPAAESGSQPETEKSAATVRHPRRP